MSGVVRRHGGGLPAHIVTDEARQLVRVLAGNGIALPIISQNLNISVPTLKKHYKEELLFGRDRVEAAMGAAIVKSALSGNWGAAKYWLCVHAKDPKWRDAARELREAETIPVAGSDEVVHFYMPDNGRDQPDTDDEPPQIDGEAEAA